MMRMLSIGLMIAGLTAFAAAQKVGLKTLKPGTYTATVKAIPCEACPPKVIETMKSVPGITNVSVDQEKSQVTFAVKPGAKVSVSALQRKLKGVSEKMGMGADYSLRDIQAVPSHGGK